jgi:hypothetical protein
MMKELSREDVLLVSGAFKLHFNIFEAVFTVIGSTILGGPVGGGVAVAALIAAQGAGNLHDMYIDEFGNQVKK